MVLRCAPHGWQGYPFSVEIEAEYRVAAEAGLRLTVTARNAGRRAAPYGTGSHPYLTLGTPSVDGCELALPARSWLPMDDRGIPSGPAAGVEGTQFDFRRPHPISTGPPPWRSAGARARAAVICSRSRPSRRSRSTICRKSNARKA